MLVKHLKSRFWERIIENSRCKISLSFPIYI